MRFRSAKHPLPAGPNEKMQMDRIVTLSAGHFINDIYPGFIPPLLPLLMTRLEFSLPLAGALISMMSLFNSFLQPVFGHVADKIRYPWLVVFGPLVTALFMSMIGWVDSYELLVVCVILSGLGTAAFHPQSAVFTSRASGRRSGLGMSIFVTGGSAGHALGPVIIIPIVTMLGLQYTFLTMVFGVLISAVMFYTIPAMEHAPAANAKREKLTFAGLKQHSAVFYLWLIVSIRAFIIIGFITFLPIFLHDRQMSLFASGVSITVLELSGAAGSFVGGSLSDIYGRKAIIVLSLFFALPFLYIFLHVNSILAFLALGAAGLFIYSSIPVVILMAQELYPERINTVSSLMMGVSWGLGGLLMTPLGIFADRYGIEAAFKVLIGLGVIATIIAALFLPKSKRPVKS